MYLHQAGTHPKLPAFLKYLPSLSLPEQQSSTEVKNEWRDALSSPIRLDVFAIDYLPLTSYRLYRGTPHDLYSGCV